MKKTIYIAIAAIAFTFAAAETSLACSCRASLDSVKKQVSKAYKQSAAIFSGTVKSIETASNGSEVIVKFSVKDTWKGAIGKEVTVTTALESSMCGYDFEVGREYLVYAYGTVDKLGVGLCSRTTSMPNQSDARYLVRLKKKYAQKK